MASATGPIPGPIQKHTPPDQMQYTANAAEAANKYPWEPFGPMTPLIIPVAVLVIAGLTMTCLDRYRYRKGQPTFSYESRKGQKIWTFVLSATACGIVALAIWYAHATNPYANRENRSAAQQPPFQTDWPSVQR